MRQTYMVYTMRQTYVVYTMRQTYVVYTMRQAFIKCHVTSHIAVYHLSQPHCGIPCKPASLWYTIEANLVMVNHASHPPCDISSKEPEKFMSFQKI